MPLVRIPAHEAVEIRKSNPFNFWGERGQPNRVEPVATPAFDVPFKLVANEAILTIGSCFARNIEHHLARHGFHLPARRLFQRPEFAAHDPAIINNYGTPSIFNELAWAFGEREYVPDDHFIEVMRGRFVDQQMPTHLRPEDRAVILARRHAITEVYRSAAECRVIIMTLGLSEVWFDTKSGFYLNVAPRPAMLKAYPGRYELHVLSYAEVLGFLADAMRLLQKHGRSDLRVLLTVSPVPLTVTHRPIDVMVANSYSKSVLRAATEEVIVQFPFVTYYPSYESVMLSDRKVAWAEDLRHVSDDIVRVNVERMVEAFCDIDESGEAVTEGGEAVAISRAQAARQAGAGPASRFFTENAVWSSKSLRFAVEHARFLLDGAEPAAALAILEQHRDSRDAAVLALKCEALLASGRQEEALSVLDAMGKRVRSRALWTNLLSAAMATRDAQTVLAILDGVLQNVPGRQQFAYLAVARFFRDARKPEEACHYYAQAMEGNQGRATLEYAELLISLGRVAEARAVLADFVPQHAKESDRLRRLNGVLGGRPDSDREEKQSRPTGFLGRLGAAIRGGG
jgi:hypothetical protein